MCFLRYTPDQEFDAPIVGTGRLVLRFCFAPHIPPRTYKSLGDVCRLDFCTATIEERVPGLSVL